jgi:dipeptidyl aminopeptidase/acylaminoacyl peptidase
MSNTAALAAPYGTWPSPLSPARMSSASMALALAAADSGRLFWIETRPQESGRSVLRVRERDGTIRDLTPPGSSARSRVHEYGGRPYLACGALLLCCEDRDQRLLRLVDGGTPAPITPAGFRYVDGTASADGRRVFFVREDHSRGDMPHNAIVALAADAIDPQQPHAGQLLWGDSDFVAYPAPNADASELAFISWNHPQMPWDGTRLLRGTLEGDRLVDVRTVAGSDSESVLEPLWDDSGELLFLSDRTGYWNLFRDRAGRIEQITDFDADLGGPLWQLGAPTLALAGRGRVLARICRRGVDELLLIDCATGRAQALPLPFVAYRSLGLLDADTGFAIASREDDVPALVTFDLSRGGFSVVQTSGETPLAREWISRAMPIEVPTHAFLHRPQHPQRRGADGEKPPLVVILHGGPTSHRAPELSLAVQFWTTRGFAVVDVNYGGSSGFGREYRERLRGNWGVVDLEDAVATVKHLVAAGEVDPQRLVIRGGSAGGYTVLCALAFHHLFAAGINYYGVADLELLARHTHKFESRYLDSLVAPWPEGRDVYHARSPLHHLDNVSGALITFQGAEDRAVPPEQSRAVVAAFRARKLPVAYLEFAGEQHGFRRAENITRALEAELYFLGRVLGFVPADELAPVAIDNLGDAPQSNSNAAPK